MKTVVCGAYVDKDGRLLLVWKKGIWILPGGKLKEGETNIGCLFREISEELPELEILHHSFLGNFFGVHPKKKEMVHAVVYRIEVAGRFIVAQDDSVKALVLTDRLPFYKTSEITSRVAKKLGLL